MCEWLAQRSLAVDERGVLQAVVELATDENRKRRSVLEAASLLATVAGVDLDTKGLRYRTLARPGVMP